jgi:terminase small subunit-like protein
MGRQSSYTPEIAVSICEGMIEGRSLREVCRAPGMPDESTVRKWAQDDVQGFAALFRRATEIRAARFVDEILDLCDADCTFTDESGRVRVDQGAVAQARLRVDTRKWLASKILPKVYGDRLVTEHVGKDGGPIQMEQVRAGIADKIHRFARTGLQGEGPGESERR